MRREGRAVARTPRTTVLRTNLAIRERPEHETSDLENDIIQYRGSAWQKWLSRAM
ncbi:hypothetical protein GCM10007858_29290 [Bradyrhizobium liaoningense]|nr:hypothetical protein GCM10007858_29290 [Bradyrhizobium liaoningense]